MREVLADIHTYCDGPYCKRIQRHEVYRDERGYSSECSRCYVSRPTISSELTAAYGQVARLQEV
jgi:ribosomal protein L44E